MLVLPLNDRHDRKGFDCGEGDLNAWLSQTARERKEKGISSTFNSTPAQRCCLGLFKSAICNDKRPDHLRSQ